MNFIIGVLIGAATLFIFYFVFKLGGSTPKEKIQPIKKKVKDVLEKQEKESKEIIATLSPEEKAKELNEKLRRFK